MAENIVDDPKNFVIENQVIPVPDDTKGEIIITMSPQTLPMTTMTETIQVEIVNGSPIKQQDMTSEQLEETKVATCLVCGDAGSGYHYSAFSCEGCKGFFKRTVQKNLIYKCKDKGNCIITKFTRNSCQHCRFQQCLNIGMKREGVREDRTPGGKHRHKRQRVDEAVSTEFVQSLGPKDYILDGLISARPDRIPKVEGNVEVAALTVNELMHYEYMELKYIIDWAKKVPGFQKISLNDQMALLKSSFMELNVLRLSYRSIGLEDSIQFADGLAVPVSYATDMGFGKELINATVEFSLRLQSIELDHIEFCILNALVLTYPDASGIQDKQKVTSIQTCILDSLRRYVSQNYPEDQQRYGKMLLRLPALRTLSAKAAERFMSLTLDGNIQINELVTEMIS